MILDHFNFSVLSKIIRFNNTLNYTYLLNKKYKLYGYIFLITPNLYRYNWAKSKSNLIQYFFITINMNFKNSFFINNNNHVLSRVSSIVIFKKKSSFLKKNFDYEFTILNKISFNKDNFLKKNKNLIKINNKKKRKGSIFFKNTNFKKNINFNKKFNFNTKTVDFNRKFTVLLKKNRTVLRKFLKVKFKRQYVFNKFIRNLSKLNHKDFLLNFEFNISSMLMRSNFFFSVSDCIWFFNNGFISLNGYVTYDFKKTLKPLEVVNIVYNSYYYYIYRKNLNDCLNSSYKLNKKIWKINKQRYEGDSKRIETYPKWIYKYQYFKNDVPKFMEVDFISMSLVILNYDIKSNYFDFYNLKFLNLYTNRLYNWKYVV